MRRSMKSTFVNFCLFGMVAVCSPLLAQERKPQTVPENSSRCARSAEGSSVPEPEDLRSQGGLLRVELSFRSSVGTEGRTNYCYVDREGRQSPNLRVHPGDTLILTLKNEATPNASTSAPPSIPAMTHSM